LGLVGSGITQQPHINVANDLGRIVHCALLAPPQKTILAAGSILSYTTQLEIWCRVNKVPFGGFDELSIDTFENFFPVPGLGRELGEMMAFMDEFGYAGDWDVVLPEQVSVFLSSDRYLGICLLTSIVRVAGSSLPVDKF